jgi:hypothetical protein
MADDETWWAHFVRRMARQVVENPVALVMLGIRLVKAYMDVAPRVGMPRILEFAREILHQTARTFGRGFLPVLSLGVVMGMAVGGIVGGFGDLIRPLFDIYAFSIIIHQVLPLILTLLVIARNGSAITGKFLTYPFGEGIPKKERNFSNALLLDLVVRHCIAAVLSSGVLYLILAGCVIVGYMSDGMVGEISVRLIGNIPGFIETKQVGTDLLSATIKSMLFAGVVSYAASALGIIGAERITSEVHESTDYYYPIWESGVIALLLCAVFAGLLWDIKFSL